MNFHFSINNTTFKLTSTYDLVNKFLTVYCKNTIATIIKILSLSERNFIRPYEVNSTLITRFDVIYLYQVFCFTYLNAEFIFLLLCHIAKERLPLPVHKIAFYHVLTHKAS